MYKKKKKNKSPVVCMNLLFFNLVLIDRASVQWYFVYSM